MTSSRSRVTTSSWLVLLAVLLLCGSAYAGRKRIVVLDFDGPKAEKFHEDVVKLIKKSHTVISVEKWNSAAEELGADAVTDKNIKKVAKKLKIDGVVTGKIEKRRDSYIVRLKLREGTTGAISGNSVQTQSESPRLDAQAQRDVKDELLGAIDGLSANHGGDDEDEADEKPTKKKKAVEEDEEEAPKKSGFSKKKMMDEESAEEEKPSKKKKMAKEEEEEKPAKKDDKKKKVAKEEEEEKPAKKEDKKKKFDDEEKAALSTKRDREDEDKKRSDESDEEDSDKKVASAEKEDEVEETADVDTGDKAAKVAPSSRAIDAVVGMSFVRRNLSFSYASDLGKPPPGYKQTIPVAGAMVDITAFPLAISHKSKAITANIGLHILYDQVLIINSQKRYADGTGMQQIADLKTSENRWAIGGVFRYPLGSGPKALVVGGQADYGRQKFSVEQTLPNMEKTDIPNVHYTMLALGPFLKYPLSSKIVINADAAFLAVLGTGAISGSDQYGKATVTGFQLDAGLDYMLKTNIFIRAGVRLETFGFKFKGDPMSQTNTRDTDPEQDVMGARDTYLGGAATLGYLY